MTMLGVLLLVELREVTSDSGWYDLLRLLLLGRLGLPYRSWEMDEPAPTDSRSSRRFPLALSYAIMLLAVRSLGRTVWEDPGPRMVEEDAPE